VTERTEAKEILMKNLAIATAAIALLATPAVAQYAGGYVQGPAYYGSTYGQPYGQPYGYAAPYASGPMFISPGYSRELDIATEPDPNVRLELRRDQTLNLDLRP
jgi:hypothetical protein